MGCQRPLVPVGASGHCQQHSGHIAVLSLSHTGCSEHGKCQQVGSSTGLRSHWPHAGQPFPAEPSVNFCPASGRCLLQSLADPGQALLPTAWCPAAHPFSLAGLAHPAIVGCYVCIRPLLHCPVAFTGRALSSPGPSD